MALIKDHRWELPANEIIFDDQTLGASEINLKAVRYDVINLTAVLVLQFRELSSSFKHSRDFEITVATEGDNNEGLNTIELSGAVQALFPSSTKTFPLS